MSEPEIPQQLLAKVRGQILQDPGVPVDGPTVSAWQEPAHPLATTQSPDLPQRTDFAVIGSGITGCSVARTLLQSNQASEKRVTVFEARSLTTGATSRNGGFLLSQAPQFYKRYVDAFGTETARQITLFCDRTLETLVALAKAEGLTEESQIRGVTTVSNFQDEDAFLQTVEAIRLYEEAIPEAKGKYTVFDKEATKRDFHVKESFGALTVKSGVFWPYRLITNVFQRLLERYPERFSIETKTPVTSITVAQDSDNAYPYILSTSRGTVRAAKIFHCVSGFTGHLLPKLRGPVFPCRLSMSTQKPGPQFGNKPYSWLFHTRQLYDPETTLVEQGLYWMQQNAGTGDLFVGGDLQRLDDFVSSDDSITSADTIANLTTLLPKKLFEEGWTNPITNNSLSSSTAIHRIWSGILSMTADQNPIVGNVPPSISGRNIDGGEWVAAGFNGYGMSQCWLCGEAIARMALAEPKPDWLPDAYLATEKRLADQATMGPEAALASFFAR